MSNSAVEVLVMRCLAHLEKEEAMLQTTKELVQQIREALIRRDQALLQELLEGQQRAAEVSQGLYAARLKMCREIAHTFAVPLETASVGFLAGRVTGSLQQRLLSCRRRLTRAAEQVDILNRGNAALASQTMNLLFGVLHRLTGVSPQPSCYERDGRMSRQLDESLQPLARVTR